jgi:hypothetical protein
MPSANLIGSRGGHDQRSSLILDDFENTTAGSQDRWSAAGERFSQG